MTHRNNGFITADHHAILDTSVSIRDRLPPFHAARFVVELITQLDLSSLYADDPDHRGAAYAPRILLGLLFYSYIEGVFHSQKIETATYESIPFHYVAGGLHPDHITIAAFRKSKLSQIQELFVEGLILARTAGVTKLGNISLDTPNIFTAETGGIIVNRERLLELKALAQAQVSELLALADCADRDTLPRDFVTAEQSASHKDPQVLLVEARAVLAAFAQENTQPADDEKTAHPYDRALAPNLDPDRRATAVPVTVPGHNCKNNPSNRQQPDVSRSNGRHKSGANGNNKPNCRTCSMRPQCIDTSPLGPGLKLAIVGMFNTNTDTHETWAKLQEACLVARLERQQAARNSFQVTGLSRRRRQIHSSPHKPAGIESRHRLTATSVLATPVPATSVLATPVRAPNGGSMSSGLRDSGPPIATPEEVAFGITCLGTERTARLPRDGQVVLGRFESGAAMPADVDLTHEDDLIPSISRRHARIIGREGNHWIEDLGSANGTYLNGYQVALGESTRLKPGDRLLLGRCRLVYKPMPDRPLQLDAPPSHSAVLIITHTGQTITVPDKPEITIGRADPSVGYNPDLDLSAGGEVGGIVSRRHARLVLDQGRHFVAGVGSSAALSVNGKPIGNGDPPLLLHPGDQLSLGGCVLAYEWRSMPQEQQTSGKTFPTALQRRVMRQHPITSL